MFIDKEVSTLPFTTGLYRLAYKAPIVESIYDYDTHTIGPYVLPCHIHAFVDFNPNNAVNMDRLYEVMRNDETILAVFNNCNRTIVAVHANMLQHHSTISSITPSDLRMLCKLEFSKSIAVGHYEYIGFVKTYQLNKSFYTEPYRLIRDINTGVIPGFEDVKLECEPAIDPPLSVYKKLIETDYRAVYVDSVTGDLHYIK